MTREVPVGFRELLDRLERIEARLGRLESGRAPPGDGRAARPSSPKPVERCPGCGLPLHRRRGRCRECGVPLSP
jgi:hypothetical protein